MHITKWLKNISLTVCVSGIMVFFATSISASAAPQTFVAPDQTKPVVVDFINGDFELPNLRETVPLLSWNGSVGTSPTVSQFWASQTQWLFLPDDEVPGWSAKPVDPADEGEPFANIIEYMRTGYPQDPGDQCIDMCGAMNQEFYQIVETTPGTNVYYSYDGTYVNMDLRFVCGDADNPDIIRDDTMTAGWITYSGQLTVSTASTYFGFLCLNGRESAPANITYNNIYYQNVKAGGIGVYLDNIKFQTQSKIIVDKSVSTISESGALFGETITYQIDVTNHGQTDTSRTILTDVLGDDVEFAGNVQINGQSAGALAAFDQGTDTLTVYLGEGATAASGGSLEGSVSTGETEGETVTVTFDVRVIGAVGSVIKNQTAVSYDDKDFEGYTQGGYRDYSNITETAIVNERYYPVQLTKQLDHAAKQAETFVFQIDRYSFDGNTYQQSFYTMITVPAGSDIYSVQLHDLYAGYYMITELNNNWRYQIAGDSALYQQVFVGSPYTAEQITFKNNTNQDYWVSGKFQLSNYMNKLPG